MVFLLFIASVGAFVALCFALFAYEGHLESERRRKRAQYGRRVRCLSCTTLEYRCDLGPDQRHTNRKRCALLLQDCIKAERYRRLGRWWHTGDPAPKSKWAKRQARMVGYPEEE